MGSDQPTRLGLLVGLTPGKTTLAEEIDKAALGVSLGIHTLTDLTISGESELRPLLIERFQVPVGSVPAYELYTGFRAQRTDLRTSMLRVLERQALQGVDFFSIHMSFVRTQLPDLASPQRAIPMTSRGGAMLATIMTETRGENPFYEFQEDIFDLCRAYDITLSLVGSFRPGSIVDAFEEIHLRELDVQRCLVERAHDQSVQTIVELLNHVPLQLVEEYISLGHSLFGNSPLGCLGPSPTDVAIGFDDVAGAIAASVATWKGASWINCITAGEHTYLPSLQDIEQAIRYFQTAIHIGTVARGGSTQRDRELSVARAHNDWPTMAKLSLFESVAQQLITEHGYHAGQPCNVCSGACPLVRTQRLTSTCNW